SAKLDRWTEVRLGNVLMALQELATLGSLDKSLREVSSAISSAFLARQFGASSPTHLEVLTNFALAEPANEFALEILMQAYKKDVFIRPQILSKFRVLGAGWGLRDRLQNLLDALIDLVLDANVTHRNATTSSSP
ncbi:hypothetical protein HDU93_005333, partial [Gonapodya sp. JEL0774]